MELVFDQNRISAAATFGEGNIFGERIGLFGKLFGCWHKELSRPFTNKRSSYRSCLNCGALKRFDTESLKTFGPFYYPPVISPEAKR